MKRSNFYTKGSRWGVVSLLTLVLLLGVALPQFIPTQAAVVTDGLDVKIVAAPNFVVDSNVSSPSTYAPRVATVIGEFCNTGNTTLTNVTGNIGDYGSNTPGIYPSRDSSGFAGEHDHLLSSGSYSFAHLGGTADATRFIGSLAPGQCGYQYWHFTYPACENVGVANDPEEPPCSGDPVWGSTNDPNDDLWLQFDIWGTSSGGTTNADNETHTARMRNEISAMANKIEPNGNPGGQWFNTDTSTVNPGDTITTNGILYRLGNIRKGFDNNNDGIPDYNAWLQPFGDPTYDPSCFRLVETTGVVTVTTNTGDVIIPFKNNLYFSDLPQNNTNVVGEVFYKFLALGGACTIPISPYQEAASGFDNEKFNGDYGSGPAPLQTFRPAVTIDKTGSPAAGATGAQVDYQIDFVNTSTQADAGIVLSSGAGGAIGLVISDTVPAGMTYIAGSAVANNSIPVGYTIRYYDTGTSNWVTTEPAVASNVSMIQWWLNEPLEKAGSGTNSGYVTFSATLPVTAPNPPFVENCAGGSFADAAAFATDCTVTMIQGSNEIGDFVWWDANSDGIQDGGESGIDGVTVSLYYDKNGDGALDDGDIFISSTQTSGGGAYSFTNLADGDFVVVVDDQDTDITDDRLVPTTTTEYGVTGLGSTITSPYLYADFGFGPVLSLNKTLVSSDPVLEGQNSVWEIDVINTLPGDGSGQGTSCKYTTYGNNYDAAYTSITGNSEWTPYTNAFGPTEPDGQFSSSEYANANEDIGVTEFAIGAQPGNISAVDALLVMRIINPGRFRPVAGESLDFELIDANLGSAIHTLNIPSSTLNTWTGTITYEVPIPAGVVAGMTVADFNSSRYTISLVANGGGGNNSTYDAYLELDAVGFSVTTDQTCGGPEDTVITVPLTDEFDPSLFEFVSAVPTPDSVTTGNGENYDPAGLINWNNLGPLYAGQTKTVTVTLKALEPSTNPENTVNYARVRNAEFANGSPVNNGDANDDVDIVPAAMIGDTIWNDNGAGGGTAGDGIEDPGESGLVGVTVRLTASTDVTINGVTYTAGSTIMTAVTDANGEYLFEGLPDTTYTVTVDNTSLTGMTATGGPHGITGSLTTVVVASADVTTIAGTSCSTCELDVDFGYTIPTLINGSVWNDHNQSGTSTPDNGEEGLTNVWVYVSDGSCTYTSPGIGTCPSVQTEANGEFEIDLTAAGWTPAASGTTYQVIVDPGTGDMSTGTWTQSFDTDGLTSAHQAAVTVIPGGQGRTDYSYYQTGTTQIDGTVYADWNNNADQDTAEDGFENVTVYLYQDENGDGVIDPEDALITSTQTDADGDYSFTNLPPDTYIVVVDESDPDLPSDYQQTEDPDLGSGTPCSGAACDGLAGADTTGGNVSNHDFGYQPVGYGSIGDYVWQDDNGNGLQDTGEPALPNITVDLYVWEDDGDGVLENGEQGAIIATLSSATDGSYLFENLPAGDYIVDVDETDTDLPSGYVVSSTYNDDDDLTTPDINNDPMGVSLTDGENFLDADFGFVAGGMIGDFIWQDSDGDGLQDPNEAGINGVTVTLWYDSNGDGSLDSSTSTTTITNGNQDGYYEFTDLPAGPYRVVVTPPANHTLSSDPDSYGQNGYTAPPCDPADGTNYVGCDNIYDLTLAGGRSNRTADFGYLPDGTIGDTLWLDFDADGVLDLGEPGISGVTLYLDDTSCSYPGTCPTATTDANGNYIFNSVSDSTYTVRVDISTLPTGITLNFDPDEGNNCGFCDNAGSVTIAGGNTDLTIDFGYIGAYSISGTVWHDDNDDANIDGTEIVRYEGVAVHLWDCGADACGSGTDDVYLGSTLTDQNGYYIFDNLPGGNYRVIVNQNAHTLDGLSPTATLTPTTQHDITGLSGSSTDNDFGFLSSIDYGDLPSDYNLTASINNGARHTISSQLYLGSTTDPDPDGQESSDAGRQAIVDNGDDNDGTNDDDGVTRQPGLNGDVNGGGWTNGTVALGEGGRLDIEIGGTWSGVPQVFIDFDGDDATYTLTEVTLRDALGVPLEMPLSPGTHSVYFDIPAGTFNGVTQTNPIFIRVRLSSTGGLGATGLASNGEVEDYQSDFGPNAVTMADFSAETDGFPLGLIVLIGFAAVLVGGVTITVTRHRKQTTVIRFQDGD